MRSMHRSPQRPSRCHLALLAAQQNQNVTQGDIQRLQDNVYLADRDVSQVRGRDSSRATQFQTELDDLRDEVVYLKVKLRKERTLTRTEYADVRDRIEDLRTRARNESTNASTQTPSTPRPSDNNRGTWQAPRVTGTTMRPGARHRAEPPPSSPCGHRT